MNNEKNLEMFDAFMETYDYLVDSDMDPDEDAHHLRALKWAADFIKNELNKTVVRVHAIETDPPDEDNPIVNDYFYKIDESITKKEDLVPVLQNGLLKQYKLPCFGYADDYEGDEEDIDEDALEYWKDMNFFFGRELADLNPAYLKKHGIELIPMYKINVDWDKGYEL